MAVECVLGCSCSLSSEVSRLELSVKVYIKLLEEASWYL